MANLAKYVVQLEAQTAKYQRGLEQANKKLDRFNRTNKRALAGIKKAFAGLATFIGVRFFANLVRSTIDATDEISKLTDRLGGTTEAFSELKFVGDLSGVTFRNLTLGLQRMSRRVAEAAVGTGEAKGALKELNLVARDVARLQIDQQFEVIAEALFGVESASDRTRLAMKLFDSEGVALLQTMKNGAQGIRDMREEAKRLGVSLGRDQVQAAVDAKDSMTRLNASFTALTQNIVTRAAPALATFTEGLNELAFGKQSRSEEIIEKVRDLRKLMETLNRQGRTGAAQKRFEAITELLKELDRIKETERVTQIIDANNAAARSAKISFEAASTALEDFITQTDEAAKRVEKVHQRFAFRKRIKEIRESVKESGEILAEAIREDEKAVAEQERAAERAKSAAESLGFTFASAFEDAIVSGGKLRDVLQGLLKDLIRIIVRQTLTKPIANFLGGIIGPIFGGARQSGGPVQPGRSFLVGEAGPELFVPNSAGRIIPSGAGGINVTNNIEVNGADPARTAELLQPLLEDNRERTKAELLAMRQRGRF